MTMNMSNLRESSHILPSSCSRRRLRHEAILHPSEIALLSLCPSAGSSSHRGMAHLFCHANVFNEAVTCFNGAFWQGSNAALLMLGPFSAPSGKAGTSPLCPHFLLQQQPILLMPQPSPTRVTALTRSGHVAAVSLWQATRESFCLMASAHFLPHNNSRAILIFSIEKRLTDVSCIFFSQ